MNYIKCLLLCTLTSVASMSAMYDELKYETLYSFAEERPDLATQIVKNTITAHESGVLTLEQIESIAEMLEFQEKSAEAEALRKYVRDSESVHDSGDLLEVGREVTLHPEREESVSAPHDLSQYRSTEQRSTRGIQDQETLGQKLKAAVEERIRRKEIRERWTRLAEQLLEREALWETIRKSDREKAAATDIQRTFRGYQTRQALQRERAAVIDYILTQTQEAQRDAKKLADILDFIYKLRDEHPAYREHKALLAIAHNIEEVLSELTLEAEITQGR